MSPIPDETVFNRIFDKLDQIDLKIDDLCNRTTRMETQYESHIQAEKHEAERKLQNSERKNKTFYIIMAIFGAVVSLLQLKDQLF